MNSKKGGGCSEHGGVRKAPTAFVFQRRNTPADFTRRRWWQSPNLPVSLVLSALTSAPFSVAEGIQLVCWLFFSLTQMFLKSLSRFTMLSTSISCYTVLSILLGNSVSLSLFSISVSSCHFFSLIEIVKKPASISSLSPMVSLFTDSLLAFWLGKDFFLCSLKPSCSWASESLCAGSFVTFLSSVSFPCLIILLLAVGRVRLVPDITFIYHLLTNNMQGFGFP